jgi:PAS domain S-box-containing protein
MTGYSLDEVVGKKPGWVLQGPTTDPACVDLMRRKIAAEEAVRVKVLNFRKDRKPFWASIEIQPIRAAQGAVEHFVAVMEDVTEKEKLEAERRLSQKLQSVGQLAAGIAHEINTPIQFVGDSIAFLDEAWQEIQPFIDHVRSADRAVGEACADSRSDEVELGDEDVDFLLDNFPVALSRAKDGVQRIGGIVRAMKEFAHPEHGDFSHADVNHALENAAIVARNEYKYVGRAIIESTPIPAVRCRISSISQVLLNLIVNAGHALADQGHTPETGHITLKTWADGEWVVISVSDNGCGIADDIKDRIFDPFFTSKEVGRGTGQGLAIARAIVVEQHAGRLLVKSALGEGSTFEVWLPKEGPPDASSVPARAVA